MGHPAPTPPQTFNHEGVILGHVEQEHGVVLHDPGESYQQPTTRRNGSSQVTLGVIEVSQVQIPCWDHCIRRA